MPPNRSEALSLAQPPGHRYPGNATAVNIDNMFGACVHDDMLFRTRYGELVHGRFN